jgi:UDP-N-acetylmuramoyl-L-alanyl-D-glutamate--2,6-diaminopimelate ligase
VTVRELLERSESFRRKADATSTNSAASTTSTAGTGSAVGAEPRGVRLEADVTAVAYDSRQVTPGAIFVALRGVNADGARFVPQAIANGAMAVVAETAAPSAVTVPWIQVPNARAALAELAATFFGNPSEELALVGITGTNGKTTISYVLASIFEAAGITCGRVGTIGYRIGARELEAPRTTPEAPELQQMLRAMLKEGCGACVMEVSSHALALRRVDNLRFAAGIFSNLTRDHLDFHGDMESYFVAKRRLFEMLPDGAVGVINLDDRRGPDLVAAARRPVTYAIDAAADVRPGPLSFSLDGLAFDVRTPRGTLRVRSALVGRPNVYNILAASAAAMALDLPFSAIETGIRNLERVPGRFQVVSDAPDDVRVIVDYAHTDDALKNLLETARPLATGRVITVFGCGGDRDRTKRSLMGAVAARLSDLVIVTSDNPRSEDPEKIIDEIRRGIVMPADRIAPKGQKGGTPSLAIVDRREAIEKAVREAKPGDLLLIAGKGHEKYQVLGDKTLPFDDVEVARGALAKRRSGSRVT